MAARKAGGATVMSTKPVRQTAASQGKSNKAMAKQASTQKTRSMDATPTKKPRMHNDKTLCKRRAAAKKSNMDKTSAKKQTKSVNTAVQKTVSKSKNKNCATKRQAGDKPKRMTPVPKARLAAVRPAPAWFDVTLFTEAICQFLDCQSALALLSSSRSARGLLQTSDKAWSWLYCEMGWSRLMTVYNLTSWLHDHGQDPFKSNKTGIRKTGQPSQEK